MKLITETIFDDLDVIEESVGGKKKVYIEGIFAQAEKQNRNGRIYPDAILEREVLRFQSEKVATGRALGELEHPNSPTIDLERASHRIVSMKKEGNNWIGKAILLDTPMGQIAKGLVEGGTTIGVSTRGMGSVTKKSGYNQINEDFKLVTVDIVGDPSGIDCFVNGIMEGIEWHLDESGVFKPDTRQKVFTEVKKSLSENARLSEITNFLKNL